MKVKQTFENIYRVDCSERVGRASHNFRVKAKTMAEAMELVAALYPDSGAVEIITEVSDYYEWEARNE